MSDTSRSALFSGIGIRLATLGEVRDFSGPCVICLDDLEPVFAKSVSISSTCSAQSDIDISDIIHGLLTTSFEPAALSNISRSTTSDVVVILACGHIYCAHCITTWLVQQPTCPLCRYDMGPVDPLELQLMQDMSNPTLSRRRRGLGPRPVISLAEAPSLTTDTQTPARATDELALRGATTAGPGTSLITLGLQARSSEARSLPPSARPRARFAVRTRGYHPSRTVCSLQTVIVHEADIAARRLYANTNSPEPTGESAE